MTRGKRRIRTLTNVRDLSTGEFVEEGTELELETKEAQRWVDAGVAEFVAGADKSEGKEVTESG